MAISDAFKQDKLFKHSQDVNQTSIGKAFYEESWQTRHQVQSSEVWSSVIDPDPAVAVAAGIAQELNYIQLTPDPSVPGNRTWVFCSTPGDLNTRIQGLIPPIKFGANYTAQLRDNNGVAIQQTWDWICDYAAGTVVFENAPTYPTPYFGKAWKYTGTTGGGGDVTSIKNTITVSKLGSELTGSQGAHDFLKIHYAFLANTSFVRVYKDDVLQTYTTEWVFNPAGQSNIGRVADLTDGVRIISPILTSTYRLEVDEWYLPITPTLMLWRNDGVRIRRQPILFRVNRGNPGDYGTLTIPIEELGIYSWRATYSDIPNPKVYSYGDRLGIGWWNKGQTLPTNWRIELYKIGKNTRASGDPTYCVPRMDNTMTPQIQSSINSIDLTLPGIFMGSFGSCRNGYYFARLRNTVTNTITNFSSQRLRLQNRGVRNENHTINYGRYRKTGLV